MMPTKYRSFTPSHEQQQARSELTAALDRLAQALPPTFTPTSGAQRVAWTIVDRAASIAGAICLLAEAGNLWEAGVLARSLADFAITQVWVDGDEGRYLQLCASGRVELHKLFAEKRKYSALTTDEDALFQQLDAEASKRRQPGHTLQKVAPKAFDRAVAGSLQEPAETSGATYVSYRYWCSFTHPDVLIENPHMGKFELDLCSHVLDDTEFFLAVVLVVGARGLGLNALQEIADDLAHGLEVRRT